MSADEGVQRSGDPYGSHIDRVTICFSKYIFVPMKNRYPAFVPLAKGMG
jgi:hypothetical protein